MRALLSTIGSLGDVRPMVALGSELKAAGVDVRLCVPPDFRDWIASLGMESVPIGPEVRPTGRAAPRVTTPDERRALMAGTVAAQFDTIASAARDCDVIVGATALQVAAPSIAEKRRIPYVFAAYCPNVVPSPRHGPPVLAWLGQAPVVPVDDYSDLWDQDAQRWNEQWGPLLGPHRASLGLAAVTDVHRYVLTARPWLAADPRLAPWPGPSDADVFQTGAWILPDERPLSSELAGFLDAGDPPIYFGFGSIRAPRDLSRSMIAAARALGRRAIVSRGWAELELPDDRPDCIAIGEVNQQALFQRVAAVVHHGGAGTTTAAARAGTPQVVVPQHYDQHYWASRVQALGIGVAHAFAPPTADSLTTALEQALRSEVATAARDFAPLIRTDGARVAATQMVDLTRSL